MQEIERESELRVLLHCIHTERAMPIIFRSLIVSAYFYNQLMKSYGQSVIHRGRKPNSIIVLLLIQHNSQFKNKAKTCLPPSMLSSPSIVHVQGCSAPQIFSKQQMSPFELCSCCSCHVFSYNFAWFLLLKRVTCPPFFCFHNHNNSSSSPGLLC